MESRAQSTAVTPIKPPCCFITAYFIIFTVGHGLHRRVTPRRRMGNTEQYAWRARKGVVTYSRRLMPETEKRGIRLWILGMFPGEIAAYKETNRAGTGAIRTYALVSAICAKGRR